MITVFKFLSEFHFDSISHGVCDWIKKKWALLCSLIGFKELKFYLKLEIVCYGVESTYGGGFLCYVMLTDMLALSATRAQYQELP